MSSLDTHLTITQIPQDTGIGSTYTQDRSTQDRLESPHIRGIITENASSISPFYVEDSHHLDGLKRERLTQADVIRAYGKGVGGRAKCPKCGKDHLSVNRHGRFKCFSCGNSKEIYARFIADGLLRPLYRDDSTYLYSKTSLCSSPSPNQKPLAREETRDAVYRALLSLSPLSSSHVRQLERRGFSILSDDFHLGTLHDPRGHGAKHRQWLVTKVLEKTGLSSEVVAGVPGFYLDKQGEVRLHGSAGMLIPTYNCRRQLIGMQLRRDTVKSDQPRYLWLSSTSMGGASGGAPVGFLEKSATSNVVDIVEGFFKALSLSQQELESRGILYMPGVGMHRQLLERLDEMEQLDGAIQKARLWFDADLLSNPNVLQALANVIRSLRLRYLEVEVKLWDLAKGKGIDDYLANGHKLEDVKRICHDDLLRGAEVRKNTAHLISSTEDLTNSTEKTRCLATPLPPNAAAILADKLSLTKEELRQITDEAMIEALQTPIETLVLHDGATGSGKSRAALLRSKEGTLYVVDNYKLLFEIARQCEALGVSYQILYGRGDRVSENADLETQARQTRIWEAAGCENIEKARILGERGYFPCSGCPLFQKKQEDGETPACRYWQQRKEATKKAGQTLTLTLIQTLVNNNELMGELGGQFDLMGQGGVTTVIFDDVNDVLGHFARPQDINLDDVAQWREEFPPIEGEPEVQKRYESYHTAIEEISKVLSLPNYPLANLYEAGRRARDAFDLEDRYFKLFLPVGEKPALNALESLAKALSEGQDVRLVREGKERSLRFLRPSKLASKLKQTRVIYLDATPHRELMSCFAASLGMRYVQTNLPAPTQNIIQIGDVLWSPAQVESSPEAAALTAWAEQQNAFILTKKAMASKGEAYFERDHRGINTYENAPFTVVKGHHAMSEEQALDAAWLWRAWAKIRGCEEPLKNLPSYPSTRKHGDPWRPWERKQYITADPLAETLRRHHQSTAILQGVARDRDPNKMKFVLSGSPIELNGEPYPIKLWTKKDLREFLRSQGQEVLSNPKRAVPHLYRLNEQRCEKKSQRILDAVAYLDRLTNGTKAFTQAEVRQKLSTKSRAKGSFAREVWEAYVSNWENKYNQGDASKKSVGHTESLSKERSLCVPSSFLEKSLNKEYLDEPSQSGFVRQDDNATLLEKTGYDTDFCSAHREALDSTFDPSSIGQSTLSLGSHSTLSLDGDPALLSRVQNDLLLVADEGLGHEGDLAPTVETSSSRMVGDSPPLAFSAEKTELPEKKGNDDKKFDDIPLSKPCEVEQNLSPVAERCQRKKDLMWFVEEGISLTPAMVEELRQFAPPLSWVEKNIPAEMRGEEWDEVGL